MPVPAECVPGPIHIYLFLFFLGLGYSLVSLNTTIGISTIVSIPACGLLYVFSVFISTINPISKLIRGPWLLMQKVHPRTYFNFNGASGADRKPVSPDISVGQVQLAMEENEKRKYRDARAIQWLIHNRTEDDELESLVMAIHGTFTSKWGVDVWRKVRK